MPRFQRDGLWPHYIDQGGGAPLVLQHGLGGDCRQSRELHGGDRRFICLDCRGHGSSALGDPAQLGFATFAADLGALLDALCIDEAALAGISMGAGVALRLAYEQPKRVRALVLIRPAWIDRPSPSNLAAFPAIAGALEAHGPEEGRARFARSQAFEQLAGDSDAAAKSLLAQFERARAVEHAAVLRRLPADRPLPEGASLHELSMPTLVIASDHDPVHPAAVARAWAGRLPRATLRHVTPKAVSERAHAEDVTAAIDGFLSRHCGLR